MNPKLLLLLLFSFRLINIFGQEQNLVPLDSIHYEYINDSLVNFTDKFYPADITQQKCPCIENEINQYIYYLKNSIKTKDNQCLLIYRTGKNFHIKTGQLINHRKKIWEFKYHIIDSNLATEYINKVIEQISMATVPKYDQVYVTHDRPVHFFGNLKSNLIAFTPRINYKKEIIELIKSSKKLIRKNN